MESPSLGKGFFEERRLSAVPNWEVQWAMSIEHVDKNIKYNEKCRLRRIQFHVALFISKSRNNTDFLPWLHTWHRGCPVFQAGAFDKNRHTRKSHSPPVLQLKANILQKYNICACFKDDDKDDDKGRNPFFRTDMWLTSQRSVNLYFGAFLILPVPGQKAFLWWVSKWQPSEQTHAWSPPISPTPRRKSCTPKDSSGSSNEFMKCLQKDVFGPPKCC